MIADITQSGSTQQGITNSMNEHISIGMSLQALGVFQTNTAHPQRITFGQAVYIETESYSKRLLHLDLVEQIAQSIHIESKRKPQSLIQRITLDRRQQVGSIDTEYVHLEAGTGREVLQIAFGGVQV